MFTFDLLAQYFTTYFELEALNGLLDRQTGGLHHV